MKLDPRLKGKVAFDITRNFIKNNLTEAELATPCELRETVTRENKTSNICMPDLTLTFTDYDSWCKAYEEYIAKYQEVNEKIKELFDTEQPQAVYLTSNDCDLDVELNYQAFRSKTISVIDFYLLEWRKQVREAAKVENRRDRYNELRKEFEGEE